MKHLHIFLGDIRMDIYVVVHYMTFTFLTNFYGKNGLEFGITKNCLQTLLPFDRLRLREKNGYESFKFLVCVFLTSNLAIIFQEIRNVKKLKHEIIFHRSVCLNLTKNIIVLLNLTSLF